MELSVHIQKKFDAFNLAVDFETKEGVVGFLGPSGAGKSMTLKCIAGLEKPDSGRIIINGKCVYDSQKKIWIAPNQRHIGFLFQKYALFPHMTVEENVAFGIMHLDREERQQRIHDYLHIVHMEEMKKRYPSELSGGQQQRIAIARALILKPELLLLDEPFSALDLHLRSRMEHQLKKLLDKYEGQSIVVSHDIHESYRLCQDLAIFHEGHILEYGKKEEVFEHPLHLEVAQITGCKNISSIQKSSQEKQEYLYCTDWNIYLELSKCQKQKLKSIGIRAHHIRWDKTKGMRKNSFKIHIVDITHSPFRVMVYFKTQSKIGLSKSILQWDISKEKWEEIYSVTESIFVFFPQEKLILIKQIASN
jgi:molybdate transport system ATP-binding protein